MANATGSAIEDGILCIGIREMPREASRMDCRQRRSDSVIDYREVGAHDSRGYSIEQVLVADAFVLTISLSFFAHTCIR